MGIAHLSTTGHYVGSWGGLELGRTEDGHNIEMTQKGEILTFEEFGDSQIDLVHRGEEITVEAVFKEWKAAALIQALWPWSNTFGKQDCVGQFGVLHPTLGAKPLVLVAHQCSPAGTDGPLTFTFYETIIAPEVARRINLNNKPRLIPLRFTVFLHQFALNDLRYFGIT